MSQLTIGVKIVETEREIQKRILDALKRKLFSALGNTGKFIRRDVVNLVLKAIKNTPEYNSLLGGKLQGELGVPDVEERLNQLMAVWAKSMIFTASPVTRSAQSLKGKLTLSMIKKDFSDVLSLPASVYTTQKGEEIPWLRWLLLEGDRIILRDYEVQLRSGQGRTGLGLTIERQSATWRVPPEFSGTVTNNFVTRAIDGIDAEIMRLIKKELRKQIKK